ncbi:SDR family NAD(P)-dependent oxidoreductase [Photobacterium ganghwense]|uniref:Short-chain dehydrogenase n=1 Tax=Photobacterium ganghwense TaxID=320778 RepID=A0A0J1H9P5_9GAMM|nr:MULTISPECIES: SDR family oxidoreductase [Photobacterium]KLV08406.1 short-chain dehydrogenase [Photobacterium ganghwense]PSU07543.1 SDR family NAD(P)-dependent oxidoreductase [Photobacterium ganghwense]
MSKIALVTGGSGGLGAAICRKLAQSGYRVVLTYNSNKQAAEELLSVLPGGGHLAYSLNVEDSSAIVNLAAQVSEIGGKLDLLVNCAGMTKFVAHSDLNGLSDALFDQIFRVNVRAPFAMVRAFTHLLRNAGGCVVNITSIAAQTAMGSNIAYCASKSATENMTRSLARALAPDIRVLAVAPGLVDTEFVKGLDDSWRNQQEMSTPLKRLASDDEVANAVYAAAEVLTFSTGNTISVDGGRPLGN